MPVNFGPNVQLRHEDGGRAARASALLNRRFDALPDRRLDFPDRHHWHGHHLMREVTILIAARNAAATIERCLQSALAQGGPVVVVDEQSTDNTAALARAVGRDRVTVILSQRCQALGCARQIALDAVTTRFAMWVAAADEALPGRAARLHARLEQEGADLAYDAADLHDRESGALVRHLPIPEYLRRDPTAVRQFERNATSSLGRPLVRTSWAARIGYDPSCDGAADYDFLLRSVMEGARVVWDQTTGYRIYTDPAGSRREQSGRNSDIRALLQKHEYHLVRTRYRAAGHSEAVTAWALAAMALYREDWQEAGGFIDEAAATIADPVRVLEPGGPCPHPEGWRRAFYRGTLALLQGRFDLGRRELAIAQVFKRAPESSNNLGIALARFGLRAEADDLFREAERACPGYRDAAHNLVSPIPSCITSHPLRRPARTDNGDRHLFL